MAPLHQGRFGQVYDATYPIDPWLLPDGNIMRLRSYSSYLFAEIAARAPGDFISVGISYGVTPKVLYELVVKGTARTYHLIDPFTLDPGISYCEDPADVLALFGGDPWVRLHQVAAPAAFPLPLPDGLAFAELSTGHADAELASMPYLIASLNRAA